MIPSNDMCPVCDYGSAAIYKDLPSPEQIAAGVVPLDSLPAAWWNCMWFDTNRAVNQARCELGILIEEINNVLCNAGVCACDTCLDQLYQSINKIRQTLGNATTAGAVKSSSDPSAVAIDANGFMSVNCLGNASSLTTAATTVVGAINELKSTYDTCWSNNTTALSGKAPTSHADSATTYGVGNADCYGHLKISDTYTSDLGCAGMAASQTALYCVYCYASGIAAGVASLGNTAGCALGTASAGTAVTAARSDHRHPRACTLVDCTNASCAIVRTEGGNELNFVSTGAWINYRGGNSNLSIGDGGGGGGFGTVTASRFCGNLCGYACCAGYADNAGIANRSCQTDRTCWANNALCFWNPSNSVVCVRNSLSVDVVAIPDASQSRCGLISTAITRGAVIAGLYVPANCTLCLGSFLAVCNCAAVTVRGLAVW